jgi:hypothetical protein
VDSKRLLAALAQLTQLTELWLRGTTTDRVLKQEDLLQLHGELQLTDDVYLKLKNIVPKV